MSDCPKVIDIWPTDQKCEDEEGESPYCNDHDRRKSNDIEYFGYPCEEDPAIEKQRAKLC